MIKTCVVCNKEYKVYSSTSKDKITCSKECKSITENEIKTCTICGEQFKIRKSHAHTRKNCSRKCGAISCSNNTKGKNNHAYGHVYRTKATHPEWAEKISQSTKGKVNVGDKNGMKKAEARAKVSATRKEMMKNPEFRMSTAQSIRKAWADGKFEGVKVGRCKWYSYTKKNGEIVKAQGTWELAFVKWADDQGLTFETHHGTLAYKDKDGIDRTYMPDFYVNDWNCWVDIKCQHFYDVQKDKIEQIIKYNPTEAIKFLLKKDLEELGISLKMTTEEMNHRRKLVELCEKFYEDNSIRYKKVLSIKSNPNNGKGVSAKWIGTDEVSGRIEVFAGSTPGVVIHETGHGIHELYRQHETGENNIDGEAFCEAVRWELGQKFLPDCAQEKTWRENKKREGLESNGTKGDAKILHQLNYDTPTLFEKLKAGYFDFQKPA